LLGNLNLLGTHWGDAAKSGRPTAENDREADLSTQQTGAQAPSRLPCASGHDRRPQGSRRSPFARPQASERLNRHHDAPVDIMDRLKKRADFIAAAQGPRIARPAFVVQSRLRDDTGPTRIGFTVTKKVGTATERNRVRRRLREMVRLAGVIAPPSPRDYVIVGRRAALDHEFSVMIEDFRSALMRLTRMKDRAGDPRPTRISPKHS
jgi:ribonuclease P protein component